MPPKKQRRLWSAESMQKAIDDVTNKKLSVLRASVLYNVPRRTLRDNLGKVIPADDNSTTPNYIMPKYGRKPVLTENLENEFVQRLFRLCDVGFPLTPKQLRKSVFIYCNEKNIQAPFNASTGTAGRKWLRLFLAHHPEVKRRRAQHLNEARAAKLNRYVVNDYFNKLNAVLDEYGLKTKPQNVYNMDEKGVRKCLHKSPTVIAKKGVRRVHSRGKEHGENVTVVGCANCVGTAIPPFVIIKGVRRIDSWRDSMPIGSEVEMSPKGSMNSVLFSKWLEHFAKFKSAGTCLLILDGAKCHLNIQSFKVAERYDIQLFLLPSNTTHELQPMDKSVFRPFEIFWDEEMLNYWTMHPEREMNKTRFGAVLTPTWQRAMTIKNIQAGFRACGIYPFCPSVIPDEAFAPSDVTKKDNPTVSSNSDEVDSPNSPETSNVPLERSNAPPKSSKAPPEKSNAPPKSSKAPPEKSNTPPEPSQTPPKESNEPLEHSKTPPEASNVSSEQLKTPSPSETLKTVKSPTFSLLSTPKMQRRTTRVYKKSINATALHLTSDVFSDYKSSESAGSDLDFKVEEFTNVAKKKKSNPPNRKLTFMSKSKEKFEKLGKPLPNLEKRAKSVDKDRSKLKKCNEAKKNFKKSVTSSENVKVPRKRKILSPRKTVCAKSRKISSTKENQNENEPLPGPSRAQDKSWYCYLCKECTQIDMRACIICQNYVHEECVGLTEGDLDAFICPNCD